VRNTPSEYIRAFRDSDRVLNYRHGYFQVQYIAPKFVDEVVRKDGRIISQKAVAVAGDTGEAETFAAKMRSSTGKTFEVRSDSRAMTTGDDNWFDVNSASGRIAQRHRGKLLEDSSGINQLGDHSYVLNPVDSAVRAAKSIAGRTIARPMLETAKTRFLAQYGYLMQEVQGQVKFPKSLSEIGERGRFSSKEVADARTTWEYINYLENGYLNSLDEVSKSVFNMIGTWLGEKGLYKLERGANKLAMGSPLSFAKNSVFWAYIGSNPLRQLFVQPHQVMRTLSYNPIGWTTGNIHKLAAQWGMIKAGVNGMSNEAQAFTKFVDDSGLLDAVDKQNLVRGTLYDASDTNNKLVKASKKVLAEIPRKVGFDTGEQANMLGHAAAVYDMFKRRGKDLTNPDVIEEAYGEIRSISGSMNFAGDMPYNQNVAGVLLQFMQVPHKMALQLTNRNLSTSTKVQMFAGDLILWGTPAYAISEMVGGDILPENSTARQLLTDGAESMLINKALNQYFKTDQIDIDFSSLAPYDMEGWGKFFTSMLTTQGGGVAQAVMNSPSGQLFLKEGGRVRNAIAAVGRFFNFGESADVTPETLPSVMNEIAKISSGWNNIIKANILLDAGKRWDASGGVVDNNIHPVEAWSQLLGFGTKDTQHFYALNTKMSENQKGYEDEVKKVYDSLIRYTVEQLEKPATDPAVLAAVQNQVLRVFADKPKAMEIISKQLRYDLTDKESGMLRSILMQTGYPLESTLTRDQLYKIPDEVERNLALERFDMFKDHLNNVKE
jgi:hypothetical protein